MSDSLATIYTSTNILTGIPIKRPMAMTAAVAVALATGFFCAPAHAKPEMAGQNASARFSAMDGNKDGKVSREEFFAAHPQMREGAFVAIDANADGTLTLEEWEAFAAGHGKGEGMKAPAAGSPAPGSSSPAPGLIMPPPNTK